MFRFLSQFALLVMLVGVGVFMFSSCDGTTSALGAATPTSTVMPPCTLNEKFYTADEGALGVQSQRAKKVANKIYYQRDLNNSSNLALARSEAIDFLAFETRRWSHFEALKIDDENSVRVMVTFVSPDLVRAALLNHALLNFAQSPLDGLSLEQFSDEKLADLNNQKRYMFLVAIQPVTTNQSSESFRIPSSQATLINNDGLHVNIAASDNFLDQTFAMTSEPHAGFLFYPFGTKNGECKHVLDPLRDTFITLSLEVQIVQEKQPLTFEIPFSSPLQVSGSIPTPDPDASLSEDQQNPVEELKELQLNQPEDDAGWHVLGRFVWEKLTYDHFSLP